MQLKALDVVVCLELARDPEARRSYAELGQAVGISASETNRAVQRACQAGLLVPGETRADKPSPNAQALLEFLEHGIRYAFFTVPGRITRGMPTAHSAPPLREQLRDGMDPPLVWPDAEGEARGQAIEPLYPSVPSVARRNDGLYELLALVDALRCGGARERRLAMTEISARILHAGAR